MGSGLGSENWAWGGSDPTVPKVPLTPASSLLPGFLSQLRAFPASSPLAAPELPCSSSFLGGLGAQQALAGG